MRLAAFLMSLAALAASPAVSATPVSPFHLEAEGTLPIPAGGYPGSRVSKASDLLEPGAGFALTASLDLGDRIAVGARSGLLRNQKTFPSGIAHRDGSVTPVEARRKLTTIPTLGLLRYRILSGPRIGVQGEAGAGVMSFTGKLKIKTATLETNILARYQDSFCYLVGARAWYALYGDLAVTGSLDFYQAVTQNGEVWRRRDNPKFVVFGLGIRYPR